MLMTMAAVLAAVAPSPQTETPQGIVHRLLDSWRAGDLAAAQSTFAPDFRLLTLMRKGGNPVLYVESREALIDEMKPLTPGGWDIRTGQLAVNEDQTGIATVWVPYTFYAHGKISHCGIESYTLYRLPEGWRILQFADTNLGNGKDANCVDRPPVQ